MKPYACKTHQNIHSCYFFCWLANAFNSSSFLSLCSHKRWGKIFYSVHASPADLPKNCLLTYESVVLQLMFDIEVGCQWKFSSKQNASLSKNLLIPSKLKFRFAIIFKNIVNPIFYWRFSKWKSINGLNFLYASLLLGGDLFCRFGGFFFSSHWNALPVIRNSLLSLLLILLIVISIESFHIWSIL